MPGVKISALPAIVAPALTDIFPEVQPATGGVTYKATFQQLLDLFEANITITESQVTNLVTDLASKLNLSGGTMTGALILNTSSPSTGLQAASKAYVDATAAGRLIKDPCAAGTTVALTATYVNGASGIGATLTNAGAMIAFAVDGYSASLNDRILIKNQASSFENGIYVVTTVGSGAANWVLTRAIDMDQPSEFKGGTTFLTSGATQGGQTYTETATVVTVGTDPVTFVLTGDSTGVTSVATGAGLTGGTITSTGTISLAAIADNTLLANVSGGALAPSATTLTLLIDEAIGAVQGNILYRNATDWVVLAPGTAGFVLQTGGPAANPAWAASSSVAAATQAEQEAATSTTVYASPGRQQFHPSAAKAWAQVSYSAGTPVAAQSYNVSSLTDVGTGNYQANFTVAMSTTTYTSVSSNRLELGNAYTSSTNASNVDIILSNNTASGNVDVTSHFAIYGDE